LPKETPAEDDEDAEEVPEVKVMEEQSEFGDMIVWGHEALPDDMADPYVRGVEEWVAFAEQVCWVGIGRNSDADGLQIHSQSDEEEKETK
jgi:hypothetical protein